MLLPIGYNNFRDIIDKKFTFVDKSLWITEVLADPAQVIVITRPRRFGKTFNLSMLHHFLAADAYGQTTQGLFDGLKITTAPGNPLSHQGRYPVIALTLKGVKDHSFENAYSSLCNLMSQVYREHKYLLTSKKLSEIEKTAIYAILAEQANQAAIQSSLANLSHYLYQHYGVKPWILIDEYDTPIQSAYLHNYYEPMISLMRNFFGATLKDNIYLNRAVITGILRISKESIFSDVNNLEVYSLLRSEHGAYFGFTETEVADLLTRFGLQKQAAGVKDWYNGYQAGNVTIYNPWSIANCIKRQGELEPYWINTSDNQLIRDLIVQSNSNFRIQFEQLLQGKPVERIIDEHMVFADLRSNETAAWSLLLMTGYLKVIAQRREDQGLWCTLDIPNREVRNLYRQIVERWLANGYGVEWYNTFLNHLLSGDIAAFQRGLTHIMEHTISSHDMARDPEVFYHGLMVGLTASLYQNKNYEIHSNRESGYGRYDYMILSRDLDQPTLLLEFKRVEKVKDPEQLTTQLEQAAQQALEQITQQKYASEATLRGCRNILKIGIAFCGKQFALHAEAR